MYRPRWMRAQDAMYAFRRKRERFYRRLDRLYDNGARPMWMELQLLVGRAFRSGNGIREKHVLESLNYYGCSVCGRVVRRELACDERACAEVMKHLRMEGRLTVAFSLNQLNERFLTQAAIKAIRRITHERRSNDARPDAGDVPKSRAVNGQENHPS